MWLYLTTNIGYVWCVILLTPFVVFNFGKMDDQALFCVHHDSGTWKLSAYQGTCNY